MWDKLILIIAALLGGIGVILGAFAAHGLKSTLSPEALSAFETGVRYQMYHALALLFVGIIYQRFMGYTLLAAALCFIVGVLLFSGSLYLLATQSGKFQWLGPVTPIGGFLLIAGWGLLAAGLLYHLK